MKKMFWVLFFLCGSVVLSGQTATPGVAVTVDGVKSNVPLTPNEFKNLTRYQNPPWAKAAARDCSIVALKSSEMDGDWEAIEFSFTPQADGEIRLILTGKWVQDPSTKKLRDLWVGYDNITITGATLVNPDFEDFKNDGSLGGWINLKGKIIKGSDLAKSGKSFIKVTSSTSVFQYFTVKKGQKVTVRLFAMPFPGE